MYEISIILFFLYCYGLGLGLGLFVKESGDFLERNLMRLGIGLGAIPALGFLLNLIRVPIDWRIFLAFSILLVVISIIKKFKNLSSMFKGFKINVYILLMLVLFGITFYMYSKGAFAYPYLEDDDSWSHAVGVKYVAVEKTVFDKPNNRVQYIDPYPPAYDMIIGILHQTNDSVFWSLKFFNALMISMGIIFFFFFVKIFANSSKKALYSTFALFAVPAFLSHFIWAISLTMPLFFVAFYSVEKIKDDKKWVIVSAIIISTALTSSPSHSTYFGLFFVIYFAAKSLSEKKFLAYHFLAGIFGVAISFILWWLPMILKHGVEGVIRGVGLHTGGSVLSIGGTADRAYTLSDFLCGFNTPCYKGSNMINNPIGIGIVISFLVVAAMVYFIYSSYAEVKKHKILILISFLVAISLILFFLSDTYVKFIDKKTVQALPKGSVPFFEFLSDQRLLVFVLIPVILVFVAVFILSIKDKNIGYLVVTLAWLIFSFYAVNAGPFAYKLSAFRAWMVLMIPLSIVAGEGIFFISGLAASIAKAFVKSSHMVTIVLIVAIGIIAYGVFQTSFIPKYKVNTAVWGSGGFWASNEEIQGYIWFKDNIPKNVTVFTFSNDGIIIGFDKYICHWCSDVREYQKIGFNQSAEQNYDWLKKGEYKYIIIDGQTTRKMGLNETNNKLRSYIDSTKFKAIFGNNGFVIFSVA